MRTTLLVFLFLVFMVTAIIAQEETTFSPNSTEPQHNRSQGGFPPTSDPYRVFDMPTWAFALIICEALLVVAILIACIAIVVIIAIRTKQIRNRSNNAVENLSSPGAIPKNENSDEVELEIKYGNEVHYIKAPAMNWEQIKQRMHTITLRPDTVARSDDPSYHSLDSASMYQTAVKTYFVGSSEPKTINNSSTPHQHLSVKSILLNQQIEWRKGEIIGVGATGKVYSGLNLTTGKMMAVKKMILPNRFEPGNDGSIRRIVTEIDLMQQLHHPNVVEYLGMEEKNNHLYIFLEYMAGGSLTSLMAKFGGTLPEKLIQKYLHQILSGLEYLHDNNVIHRDIKGANILMDRGEVKLADFGLSKILELSNGTASYTTKGTPAWMAKEIICTGQYSFASDIYAVGCTLIEMLTGKPAWSELEIKEPMALMMKIATCSTGPQIPNECSPELYDLITKCLQVNPGSRPSAKELLVHPFLTMRFTTMEEFGDVTSKTNNEFSDYESNGISLNRSLIGTSVGDV